MKDFQAFFILSFVLSGFSFFHITSDNLIPCLPRSSSGGTTADFEGSGVTIPRNAAFELSFETLFTINMPSVPTPSTRRRRKCFLRIAKRFLHLQVQSTKYKFFFFLKYFSYNCLKIKMVFLDANLGIKPNCISSVSTCCLINFSIILSAIFRI